MRLMVFYIDKKPVGYGNKETNKHWIITKSNSVLEDKLKSGEK